MPARIVTLTTDFGEADAYVGAMKGVILSIHPEARLVDLSHDIDSQDVTAACLLLEQIYGYFPEDTIFVTVVDPEVGTERAILAVRADRRTFLAPDNGVFSLIYPEQEKLTVMHITAAHYFRTPVSNTFHARDIFASAAGYLSKGIDPTQFGEEITEYVKLNIPKPAATSEKAWKGIVLKVDRFGNIITNISPADCPALFADPTPGFKITAGGKEITKLAKVYADGAPGEIFAILGSSGHLEIATNRGGAAKLLSLNRGGEVALALT